MGMIQREQCSVAGASERGDKTSDSIKGGKHFDKLGGRQRLKKTEFSQEE
jgi:hypothetical protein